MPRWSSFGPRFLEHLAMFTALPLLFDSQLSRPVVTVHASQTRVIAQSANTACPVRGYRAGLCVAARDNEALTAISVFPPCTEEKADGILME